MLQKTLIGLDLDNHSAELSSAHKFKKKKYREHIKFWISQLLTYI